jgi:hypothetical protein
VFAEALVALPGGIHVGARYEFARLWHDRAHRDTFLPQRAATLGDLVRSKTVILIILAILAFVQGAVGQFFYPGQVFSRSDIIFSLVGLALVFAWYRIDAEERNYRRSIGLNIAIVAVTIIAFPYYFFRSRGAVAA